MSVALALTSSAAAYLLGLDEAAIRAALDACLATDAEMDEYRAIWSVDEERLREANGEVTPFRFAVGDAVECCLGAGEWQRGVVLKQYHREAAWPSDRWMPYHVQLDDGELIWAPADSNACIRSAS